MKKLFAILAMVALLVLGSGIGDITNAGLNAPTMGEITLETNPLIPIVSQKMMKECIYYIFEQGNLEMNLYPFMYMFGVEYRDYSIKYIFFYGNDHLAFISSGAYDDCELGFFIMPEASTELLFVAVYTKGVKSGIDPINIPTDRGIYKDHTNLVLYNFHTDIVVPWLNRDKSIPITVGKTPTVDMGY